MPTYPWLGLRKSTYRWEDFVNWLNAGFLGPIPTPHLSEPRWQRLPSALVCQMARDANTWLLTVLAERQQRGLTWNEATDGPLLVGQVQAWLIEASEAVLQASWLSCRIEEEMRRLIRLLEAPDRAFQVFTGGAPWGQPWEQRWWALAIGLVRISQLYAALEQVSSETAATTYLRAAAARVRQQVTQAPTAA
jgi:hypothetical protein